MAIGQKTAKQICTKAEYQLYLLSAPRTASKLSRSDLKKATTQTRSARNKYRDLANQQRREARGKQKPRGTRPSLGNQRTEQKRQLFDEILGRLDKVSAKDKTAKKKTSTARGKLPGKKATTAKGTGKKKTATRKSTAKKKTVKKKVATKPAAKKPVKKKTTRKKPATKKPATKKTSAAKKPSSSRSSSPGKKKVPATTDAAAKKKAKSRGGKSRAGAAAKRSRLAHGNQKRSRTHLVASGRRRQAARDSR